MRNKREKGSLYEEKAAIFLNEKGMTILERNYRCRIGEIDLIAKEKNTLVFVEVKYRSNSLYGMPESACHTRKQQTIRRVAQHYLYEKQSFYEMGYRFDVVAFLGEAIRYYPNAF